MNALRSHRWTVRLGIALTAACGTATVWADPTTLSSGHVDIFEAEYEELVPGSPELHLGVHTDDGHYEPGDVLLQVKSAAYRSTDGLPAPITTILGSNAWILPSNLEEAAELGVLEAGVARAPGFPDATAVTFTMVASGTSNPGNFVLFNDAGTIRLSATGSTIGTGSFTLTASHLHWNWGFSAPGTYTFGMQASYNDPVAGPLQSPVETYTFQVVPEPSTWALAGTAAVGVAVLRRLRRGGALTVA
jgi:surface-anchored protein